MNYQYIPIIVIGLLAFIGLFCILIDMIYNNNNTEEDIVYLDHQPLETSLEEFDDDLDMGIEIDYTITEPDSLT